MHALKTRISPNHDDRKMKTRRANKNKRTRMQITDQENEDASSEPKNRQEQCNIESRDTFVEWRILEPLLRLAGHARHRQRPPRPERPRVPSSEQERRLLPLEAKAGAERPAQVVAAPRKELAARRRRRHRRRRELRSGHRRRTSEDVDVKSKVTSYRSLA